MPSKSYNKSVFINCPIDRKYEPMFRSAVFAVLRCNFFVRCAQEEQDSSAIRVDKIFRMINECKFGIHDISRTQPDKKTQLPRFNMPLELGIFLGAKHFGGGDQVKKNCLIFEKRSYSYDRYISDIKGQDIKAHQNKPQTMIIEIRDWLTANSNKSSPPGGTALWKEYQQFSRWLPNACWEKKLKTAELTYHDYANLVYEWIETM